MQACNTGTNSGGNGNLNDVCPLVKSQPPNLVPKTSHDFFEGYLAYQQAGSLLGAERQDDRQSQVQELPQVHVFDEPDPQFERQGIGAPRVLFGRGTNQVRR